MSPDMTVEQCELFSLPKSYHCIQVEAIGVWPSVPKNKVLASFLMAVPTQPRTVGRGDAAEEKLRRKPNVGFTRNCTLCSSAPTPPPCPPPKKRSGVRCVGVWVCVWYVSVFVCLEMAYY